MSRVLVVVVVAYLDNVLQIFGIIALLLRLIVPALIALVNALINAILVSF